LGKKREDDSSRRAPIQALRADAQRNYDALLDAAARVFATEGVDAPVKEIAMRAGVGVGTLYRRFPTRSDLIVAVFRHEVEFCVETADILASKYEPFEALTRWVSCYQDLILMKRGLAAALHSDEPTYAELPTYFEASLVPPLTRLLCAGIAQGSSVAMRARDQRRCRADEPHGGVAPQRLDGVTGRISWLFVAGQTGTLGA